MNPAVLAFHASIVALWLLSVYWIYFNNGAKFIENHPGLIRRKRLGTVSNFTEKEIKLYFPIVLIGGIAGMVMMWFVSV